MNIQRQKFAVKKAGIVGYLYSHPEILNRYFETLCPPRSLDTHTSGAWKEFFKLVYNLSCMGVVSGVVSPMIGNSYTSFHHSPEKTVLL